MYLYTEPQETITVLTTKVLALINVASKPKQFFASPDAPFKTADDIQLRFPADVPMEAAKTVADYEIKTGDIVHLLFRDSEGNWEPINIHEPEIRPVEKEVIDAIKAQQRGSLATSMSSAASSSSSSA